MVSTPPGSGSPGPTDDHVYTVEPWRNVRRNVLTRRYGGPGVDLGDLTA